MYTDPGIFQMVIAAIVGAALMIPAYLFVAKDKIRSVINAIFKRRNKE